jgi:hypothetical protein
MRYIDIAKQWPDITRKRNLGHNVLLPTENAECEICKHNIGTNRAEDSFLMRRLPAVHSPFWSVLGIGFVHPIVGKANAVTLQILAITRSQLPNELGDQEMCDPLRRGGLCSHL